MGKKNRINKRTIKINLLFTCIFLILIGMLVVGKGFTKGEVKAEPVNIVSTSTNNEEIQSNTSKNSIDKQIQDNFNENQIEEIGKKYIYDAMAVSSILNYKEKNNGKKIAFLTFDDGPSTTVTPVILDILKQYDVKATFFLVGENIDRNEVSKNLVKREFSQGNSIGNHTYSHNRGNRLFPNRRVNVPAFMADVEKTDKSLKNILGQDFNTRILRLPGGYMSRTYYRDPNLPGLDVSLKEKNMISIDWNVIIKDAEGKTNKSSAELINILKEGAQGKDKVIILMHDTYGKMQTANALPQIIEYLKAQGYEFRTIN